MRHLFLKMVFGLAVVAGSAVAMAQPAGEPQPPADDEKSDYDDEDGSAPADQAEPAQTTIDPYEAPPPVQYQQFPAPPAKPPPQEPEKPEPPAEPLNYSTIINAANGYLLPAGVITGELGVDTGGGFKGKAALGLGDVAEFKLGFDNLTRSRACPTCEVEDVQGYPWAEFKMGVGENLLFKYQPAVSLGFRKSFTREVEDRDTRTAKLYAVASISAGDKVRLHGGGVFWDASIERFDGTKYQLHDRGTSKQLRAYGGIEIRPLPRSEVMLELDWTPEFKLDDASTDKVSLRPMFSWGVRYHMASWAVIESGVRIPDVQDLNLIDAQIFGQIKFVSRYFNRLINR